MSNWEEEMMEGVRRKDNIKVLYSSLSRPLFPFVGTAAPPTGELWKCTLNSVPHNAYRQTPPVLGGLSVGRGG